MTKKLWARKYFKEYLIAYIKILCAQNILIYEKPKRFHPSSNFLHKISHLMNSTDLAPLTYQMLRLL